MAVLVKYITFVVVFLSATQLACSTEVKLFDASDVNAVKEYADFVARENCSPFDPIDKSVMDASALDADTLYRLLVLRHTGTLLEVCVPKESERLFPFFINGHWTAGTVAVDAIVGISAGLFQTPSGIGDNL